MAKKHSTFPVTQGSFFFFSLTGFVFQIGLVWAWFFSSFWVLGILFHGISVVCFLTALLQFRAQVARQDKRVPTLIFMFMLNAFFPAIGLVAALIFYVPVHWGSGKLQMGLYDDYEAYISEKKEKTGHWQRMLNPQQEIRREVGFQSVADIMAGQDIKLKIKAIARLSKNISRENVKLLKQALTDSLAEVRMYAASALIKMDQEINDQIHLAKQWTQKRASARDFSELGNLYQAYTASGLLDETLSQHYLRLTADAYRQALDQDTQQPQLVVDYARCLLELQDNERAKLVLNRAFQIWPRDSNIVFLRNEALFRLRQLQQVSVGFKSLDISQLDESQRKVVEFWTPAN